MRRCWSTEDLLDPSGDEEGRRREDEQNNCGDPIPYTIEVSVLGEQVASETGEISFGETSEQRIQFQVP